MMEKISRTLPGQLVEIMVRLEARKVTKFLSPRLTVKLTRRGGAQRGYGRPRIMVLTIGRPNYAERTFIKACLAAGEPFPVKKLQIRL